MLSIATCLAKKHDVTLFWNPENERAIREEAERKFAMKLDKVSFTPSIFDPGFSFFKRLSESRKYDLIFVLSDGSIPILLCSLILHFQTPVEWVNGNSPIEQMKLRKVRTVLVNSEFTKHFIDRKFHINSTVLYPPLNLPEIKPRKKEKIILNVGRFGIRNAGSSYKKQEVLAKTFQEMVEKGLKDWELVFIMSVSEGEQEKAEAFAEIYKKFPIKLFINPDLSVVSEMYNKASIYWHAAGFGENLEAYPDRAEHFGIATVEAMSRGVVPVVIHAGGQPEIVTDGENGFLWRTTEELIEKTMHLIEDTKLREILSRQAEKRAERFDIKRFNETLENIVT